MTEMSRRGLLRTGAVVAFLTPMTSVRNAVAVTTARRLYTRARFRRLRNRRFRLVGETGSWPVTLTRVGNLPGAPRGDKDRFALTFTCHVAGPPQGSYALRRRRFAATTLFVVPSDPTRRTYEAVVNNVPR